MKQVATVLALVLVVAVTSGCGGRLLAEGMIRPTVVTPLPAAPADQALVVFVRPSAVLPGAVSTILDGDGRFYGRLLSREMFSATFAPGHHRFVAMLWGGVLDTVEADLLPGRVYFVLVSTASISALTPRREEWPRLAEFLHVSERMDVDRPAGEAWLRQMHELIEGFDVPAYLAQARAEWEAADEEHRAIRTLAADDGLAAMPAY
jgi:hypothetical protein